MYKRYVSTNGGNYLSTLYEVGIKGSTKRGDKETNIFVKRAIDSGTFELFSLSDAYKSEILFYNELSKVLAALQEDANIPLEERYKMVKTYDESDAQALIMENLAKKGYTTFYRMDVIPIKFMEICVEHLAKFHALSFVLKEKRPEYFDKKLKNIKNPLIFNNASADLINKLKHVVMDRVDEELKPKVDKAYNDIVKILPQGYSDESIKVALCHGDYRPNNILVKMDEGEIQDIVPVDYQLIYYGSPAVDFIYLIYFSTDRKFRQAHLSDLKDLYYAKFSSFLKYFDLDAKEIYSREEFERVYKEKREFGPMHAMLAMPFLFAREDHVIDISAEKLDDSVQLDDRFQDRLRGLIEDLEEWGYY